MIVRGEDPLQAQPSRQRRADQQTLVMAVA
jgi:hypothetical protein